MAVSKIKLFFYLTFVLSSTVQANELISVNLDGKGNQNEFIDAYYDRNYSVQSQVTPDGHYVVFASGLLDLVPEGSGINTSNDRYQSNVFLRDREKQETIAISVPNPDTGATELDGAISESVGISDDGRYIVFASNATNLVSDYNPTENRDYFNIYYYDRSTQRATLVSKVANGLPDGSSRDPVISGDGRYIVYDSSNSQIIENSGIAFATSQIFLYDMATKTNTIVSRADGIDGEISNTEYTYSPAISKDGRYVIFKSKSSNLTSMASHVDPDFIGFNVFVRDTVNHTTKLVSKKAGTNGEYVTDVGGTDVLTPSPVETSESNGKTISDDGCYIVYHSDSTQLVENDTNDELFDVFLYDQCNDITTKITSQGIDGKPVNGNSTQPHISGNGRYITFWSNASNLVEGDTNDDGNYQFRGFPVGDIFLYDQETKTIARVNVDENGEQAELNSLSAFPASVTNDGYVAYGSNARNLVPEAESKGGYDIYYSKPIVKEVDNQGAISSIPSSNVISLSLLTTLLAAFGFIKRKHLFKEQATL